MAEIRGVCMWEGGGTRCVRKGCVCTPSDSYPARISTALPPDACANRGVCPSPFLRLGCASLIPPGHR